MHTDVPMFGIIYGYRLNHIAFEFDPSWVDVIRDWMLHSIELLE